ncbi:MAG: dephospho-CoA kinase [Omnitrophica WOR_2 bacterium RIFCSPHIGHO2_02_FULL_52_10]|nr:MAG: dephospho-CoA kinase [Omnitrophica WOR_2 bacterium RIFCSPHIGHO2_02_FULL_52_10]
MRVIGLTGGLATGKSTVAAMLAKLGAKVINADKIAHQQMRPGTPGWRAVVKLFGKEVLNGGRVNRRAIAGRVFKDRTLLSALNRIVHPAVRAAIIREIARLKRKNPKAKVVLDVPLLFESGMGKLTDVTVVVRSSREKQIARAKRNLGITAEEARRRIMAQMPLREKIRQADIIIDNNGTLNQTQKQVKRLWQKLQ